MRAKNSRVQLERETQHLIEIFKQARRRQDTHTAHQVFTRLYNLLHKPLYSHLRQFKYLSDIQCDELASETFYRVFNALESYEPRGNIKFVAWLFTIARNLIYSSLANGGHDIPAEDYVYLGDRIPQRDGTEGQTYEEVIPNHKGTPEHQVLSKEFDTQYQRALLEMNPIDMLILHWRTSEKLPHREIATRLSAYQGRPISDTCVRQRYHRSQKRLRKKLNRYWISQV